MRRARTLWIAGLLLIAGAALVFAMASTGGSANGPARDSVCRGTAAAGRLEHSVQFPARGFNFRAYSRAGVALGRTHAHARVVRASLDAYAALAQQAPEVVYVYGESGRAQGGPFSPHRTHQNGTSVDFMVPVRDRDGRSVPLPGNAANRFGYDLEFDAEGRWRAGTPDELRIDFEAVAAHLRALSRSARAQGAPVSRVIFAPEYLPRLFATRHGPELRRSLRFVRGQVWWRHDEHYHVDFAAPCRPLRG